MDPLTFVITVASAVLANVITDLITQRVEGIAHQDIVNIVSTRVDADDPDVRQLEPKIIEEVYTIARQDKQLEVSKKGLSLSSSTSNGSDELKNHLEYLRTIVEQRRRDLGLPLADDLAVGEKGIAVLSATAAATWIAPIESDQPNGWQQERLSILDQVRRRRAGEGQSDAF